MLRLACSRHGPPALEKGLIHHDPVSQVALRRVTWTGEYASLESATLPVLACLIMAVQDGSEQITRDLLDLVAVDHAAQRSGTRRPGRQPKARATAWTAGSGCRFRFLRRSTKPSPPGCAASPHYGLNPGDLRRHLRAGQAAGLAGRPGGDDRVSGRAAGPGAARAADAGAGLAVPAPPRAAGLSPLHRPARGWHLRKLRFRAVHHSLWMRWERRLNLLLPVGYRRSMFMAVIFPEAAALAAVLAAPSCQALTADGAPADMDGFYRVAQHALACADPPHRHDITDALMTWLGTRAASQLLQPASVYSDTGHHDDGTPRITHSQRAAEQLTVNSFRRDRRAPRAPQPGSTNALRPPASPDGGI